MIKHFSLCEGHLDVSVLKLYSHGGVALETKAGPIHIGCYAAVVHTETLSRLGIVNA